MGQNLHKIKKYIVNIVLAIPIIKYHKQSLSL